mmetsp:Transcript_3542/g.5245  ORF Transcript_3542/g.5245 Transcript_3542/m.5245 type:complete len:385 (-) Transcript_3542:198-1352(-)
MKDHYNGKENYRLNDGRQSFEHRSRQHYKNRSPTRHRDRRDDGSYRDDRRPYHYDDRRRSRSPDRYRERDRSRSRDRRDERRLHHHEERRRQHNCHPRHGQVPLPKYEIVENQRDQKLEEGARDPRDYHKRMTQQRKGRNTESFDPASTLVRPDLRIRVGSASSPKLTLKHDDVVIVPELFGKEEDWSLYYKLVDEITESQKQNVKGSEWISWHEGAHLISKNPEGAPTFQMIISKLCEYFSIRKESAGTRFNWYKDSADWKPFHHDSAAFNPRRAKNQNITVGVSFGAIRELAFLRASPLENGDKVRIYFPQTNNGVFSFGRDSNILWKHGINALPPEEQNGKGRISIILWGLAENVIEEKGSPPLLGSDGQGPHARRGQGRR